MNDTAIEVTGGVKVFPLGDGVSFIVNETMREVVTRYEDTDTSVCGVRSDTEDNVREAAAEGYGGPDAVFHSLIDHEYLHTIVSRIVFGRESYVLRFFAGLENTRYSMRLYEESIVLALQYYLNTGAVEPALIEHLDLLQDIELLSHLFRPKRNDRQAIGALN